MEFQVPPLPKFESFCGVGNGPICFRQVAMGHNPWLHFGVDEHPFATKMLMGFDPQPSAEAPELRAPTSSKPLITAGQGGSTDALPSSAQPVP